MVTNSISFSLILVEERDEIDMNLLEKALMNVIMGRERKSMLISDKTKRLTAYHEGR